MSTPQERLSPARETIALHHGRGRQKGVGLAGVLAVMVVAALAAFTMVAVVTAHAQRAKRTVNQQDARYLAEGAIAQVLAKLRTNTKYGTTWPYDTLTYGSGNAQAIVTFSRYAPYDTSIRLPGLYTYGVPFSTNQISPTSSYPGYGGITVPYGTAHVIATAASGGQQYTIEAIVGAPQFPFVISSSGHIQSSGTLICKAATNSQTFLADPTVKTSGQPSNIGAAIGINIDGSCEVSGDVVATDTSTVTLPPAANIGGAVRSGDVRLPEFYLEGYDPARLITSLAPVTDSTLGQSDTVYNMWDSRHYDPSGGTLTVQGDLNITGSTLYVNGNLTIKGGLKGRGIVVCTGNVIVEGAVDFASLRSDQILALLVRGDVTLRGSGTRSCFQGLVCANGSFTANNLTIAGIFMSGSGFNGGANTAPSTALSNVTAIYLPEAASISTWGGSFAQSTLGVIQNEAFGFQAQFTERDGVTRLGLSSTAIGDWTAGRYARSSPLSDVMTAKVLRAVQTRLRSTPGPFPRAVPYTDYYTGDAASHVLLPFAGDLGSWPDKGPNRRPACYSTCWLALPLPSSLFNGQSWSLLVRRPSRIVADVQLSNGTVKAVGWGSDTDLLSQGTPTLHVAPSDAVPKYSLPSSNFGIVQTTAGPFVVAVAKQSALLGRNDVKIYYGSSDATNFDQNWRGAPGNATCTTDMFYVSDSSLFNQWLTAAGATVDQLNDQQSAIETLLCEEYNKAFTAQSSTSVTQLPSLRADINKFFGTELPLRIISWQEHE